MTEIKRFDNSKRETLFTRLQRDWKSRRLIRPMSFFMTRMLSCMLERASTYRKLIKKSQSKMSKELDL